MPEFILTYPSGVSSEEDDNRFIVINRDREKKREKEREREHNPIKAQSQFRQK